ncbi:TlpA family protein disulfide reductase [Pseudoflavitalea sp. X16]|uniref:TlpA family protein disulfide reductase n=1 Tax=Paraflavitalea devenefica TaxID=2716334 RepID=UPI0014232B38|nr:TlpA disulfide reductase family protein [Paraflavitalea devenefica]NII27571.1 TlpA family protein disulfide reductase [Paraflavitalea devenefica]
MKWSFLFLLAAIRVSAQTAEPPKTVMAVRFDNRSQLIFNALSEDQTGTDISFRNPGRTDTTVTKHLSYQKPFHIYYANVDVSQDGKTFAATQRSLLLLPGDSVVLDRNGRHFVFGSYSPGYLDELLDLTGLYFPGFSVITKQLQTKGLAGMIKDIQQRYIDNERKINAFAKEPPVTEALHNFNYLIKARGIMAIPKEQAATPAGKKILDSCYTGFENNISKIAALQSPFTHSILYNILTYRTYRAGKPTTNIWDYFATTDPKIASTELYRSFLLNLLHGNYKGNTDQLKNNIARIKKAGIEDPRYDSLLQAKIALRENQTLQAVASMEDIKGALLNYFNFIRSQKGSYLFVDFWASWCGPCRRQMPYLKKLLPDFAGKGIKFISVSIDENDKIDDWIAASKDEGLYNNPYNFRLEQGSHNKLLKILEIRSVPRYLLYDPEGKLISAQFITPDKKEFKEQLLKEIKAK